MNSRLWSK